MTVDTKEEGKKVTLDSICNHSCGSCFPWHSLHVNPYVHIPSSFNRRQTDYYYYFFFIYILGFDISRIEMNLLL